LARHVPRARQQTVTSPAEAGTRATTRTQQATCPIQDMTLVYNGGTTLFIRGVSRPSQTVDRIISAVSDALGFGSSEAALIQRRCLRAGIPIFLNGRCILRPINTRPGKNFNFARTDRGLRHSRTRYLLPKKATPGTIPCSRVPLGSKGTDWIALHKSELTTVRFTGSMSPDS
jgi:hypothetical protein